MEQAVKFTGSVSFEAFKKLQAGNVPLTVKLSFKWTPVSLAGKLPFHSRPTGVSLRRSFRRAQPRAGPCQLWSVCWCLYLPGWAVCRRASGEGQQKTEGKVWEAAEETTPPRTICSSTGCKRLLFERCNLSNIEFILLKWWCFVGQTVLSDYQLSMALKKCQVFLFLRTSCDKR